MSKSSKGPGVCVFCGKSSVTKQHVWPDWMKAVVPRGTGDHLQFSASVEMDDARIVNVRPVFTPHRGPVGSAKIRRFCKSCNSGWMSKLEAAAKPILVKLITG